MTNISDMREFFDRWVELFERVEHMVIEGEDGLWLIDWLIDWFMNDWGTCWSQCEWMPQWRTWYEHCSCQVIHCSLNSLYLALSEKLNRKTATNYESQTNQVSVSIKESSRVTIVFLFLAPRTVQHAPHNAQILYWAKAMLANKGNCPNIALKVWWPTPHTMYNLST